MPASASLSVSLSRSARAAATDGFAAGGEDAIEGGNPYCVVVWGAASGSEDIGRSSRSFAELPWSVVAEAPGLGRSASVVLALRGGFGSRPRRDLRAPARTPMASRAGAAPGRAGKPALAMLVAVRLAVSTITPIARGFRVHCKRALGRVSCSRPTLLLRCLPRPSHAALTWNQTHVGHIKNSHDYVQEPILPAQGPAGFAAPPGFGQWSHRHVRAEISNIVRSD